MENQLKYRSITLEKVENFRELRFNEKIKPGMIYRSASLGNASEKDIKELKQRVKLIIDLRRSEEIAVEPGEHKIYQEFPFEEKKTEEEKEDQNETYFDVEKKSAIQMSIMTGDFF